MTVRLVECVRHSRQSISFNYISILFCFRENRKDSHPPFVKTYATFQDNYTFCQLATVIFATHCNADLIQTVINALLNWQGKLCGTLFQLRRHLLCTN